MIGCNRHATTPRSVITDLSLFYLPWSECHHIIIPAQDNLEKTGFSLHHRVDASSAHHLYLVRVHSPRLANPALSVTPLLLHRLLPFMLHFPRESRKKKERKCKPLNCLSERGRKFWMVLIPNRNMDYIKNIFHQSCNSCLAWKQAS